jgi:hypothetical protein
MELKQVLNNEVSLSNSEKISISLVDIAKAIKQQLKKEYVNCEFSIKTQFYSGGCSLHISIMKTDFKIIMPFNDITEEVFLSYKSYSKEDIKKIQESKHYQLSPYNLVAYNPKIWNNGVFLTEKGFNLVKRITELANKFNWDNSDSQIDYFDVKFYLHLNIGKYNKDYIEVLK